MIPLVTLLAGETVEMVDVALGSHYHLESRDWFTARRTTARCAKHSRETNK